MSGAKIFGISAALGHNTRTNATFAAVLCRGEWNAIPAYLSYIHRHASEPLLLPIIMADLTWQSLNTDQISVGNIRLPIQYCLGCSSIQYFGDHHIIQVNLEDMPQKLTQLANFIIVGTTHLSALHKLCDCLLAQLSDPSYQRSGRLTCCFETTFKVSEGWPTTS